MQRLGTSSVKLEKSTKPTEACASASSMLIDGRLGTVWGMACFCKDGCDGQFDSRGYRGFYSFAECKLCMSLPCIDTATISGGCQRGHGPTSKSKQLLPTVTVLPITSQRNSRAICFASR